MKVLVVEDAKREYIQLNKTIDKKILLLKQNHQHGTFIQKNKIPRYYLEKYEINNLWKINLPHAWRMIYTVITKPKPILIIIDILDHKSYSKKFGYKP